MTILEEVPNPTGTPLATKHTYGFDFRWIFTKKTWIFPSAQMRKTKAHPDQSRSLWSHHPLWVWPGWRFTIPWAATTWNMGGFHTWMVYFMENPNLKLVGGWSISIITIDGWGFNQSYGDMDEYDIIWLVVEPPLWKMMEFVSWDDDIPNIWKNQSHVPNHRPENGWFRGTPMT